MVEKIKVKSSNLEFVEYIADKKELRIWFLNEKDVIYAYADVTQKIYDELINASSIGGFFTEHIKYKFQFKKEMDGSIEEVIELKTLKDIKSVGTVGGIANYYEDIRQEAIKHIKSNKVAVEIEGTLTHDYSTSVVIKSAQTDWIKYFFNITKEDLKCQKKVQ